MNGLSRKAGQLASTVMARCDELASISTDPSAISRFYLTREHRLCNEKVADWMRGAGMSTWVDPAGNLWGRYHAAEPTPEPVRALVIGSHQDSVPNAGRYDGPLGVLTALAVVEMLHSEGERLPFHIDVVAFGDEEGVRFGTTLLGSYPVAGQWNAEWWNLKDDDGVTMREAFAQFGLDADRITECARDPGELMGYLELHIEQGPVLEEGEDPLGVVTGIAGARRFRVTFSGRAGHSGTVPMAMRRDALTGAGEAVLAVERIAREEGVVATVGQLECGPGAVNVIPGEVVWSLDIRAPDDVDRDASLQRIRDVSDRICAERGLSSHWQETHSAAAVDCAQRLQAAQLQALESLGLGPIQLMSGAGHDAMAMAHITDVGMFFIRCAGGVSHHPDESVLQDDVAWGIAAIRQTLFNLDQRAKDAAAC